MPADVRRSDFPAPSCGAIDLHIILHSQSPVLLDSQMRGRYLRHFSKSFLVPWQFPGSGCQEPPYPTSAEYKRSFATPGHPADSAQQVSTSGKKYRAGLQDARWLMPQQCADDLQALLFETIPGLQTVKAASTSPDTNVPPLQDRWRRPPCPEHLPPYR